MKDVCHHRAKMLPKISVYLLVNSIEFLSPSPPLHYVHQKIIACSLRKYLQQG
jgi:hypothetical protein